MKKFALATATALTLAMGANVAFAQTSQAPMTLAAGEIPRLKKPLRTLGSPPKSKLTC